MRMPLLLALFAAGCAGSAAQVRELTYPPGFHYLSEEQIRGPMGRMARSVGELDQLLHEAEAAPDEAGRQRIVELLASIDGEASKLEGPALGNHPKLVEMPAFRSDVALARRGALASPPNYFAAGLVAQSCLRCHAGR